MGGGGKTQTSSTDPWSGQQPYLQEIFANAQRQYQEGGPEYFRGPTVAAPAAATLQAQQGLLNYATGGAQDLANASQEALRFNLTDARNVESNPYLQGAINAAIRPVEQSALRVGGSVYGQGEQAMQAGQFGGTRQGIGEGLAISDLLRQEGDIAAGMASNAYNTGLQAATTGISQTPDALRAGTMPSAYADVVGQQQRAYEQELTNAAIEKWNFYQNREAAKLGAYKDIVSGGYGGQSTTPVAKGNKALGMAGGAMSGAAIGTAITPGIGTAIGAAAGALIGLIGT